MSISTQFKKFNRKYIIITSMTDTALPAESEVLGEGVCVVHTPSGQLEDATGVRVGDGKTPFGSLPWLGETEIGSTEDLRDGWYTQNHYLLGCEQLLEIPTVFTIGGQSYTVEAGTIWADFCNSASCPNYITLAEDQIRAFGYPILNPFGDEIAVLEPIGSYEYIINGDLSTTLSISFEREVYTGSGESGYEYSAETFYGKYAVGKREIEPEEYFTGTSFSSSTLTLPCKLGDTIYICPDYYIESGIYYRLTNNCSVDIQSLGYNDDYGSSISGFVITVTGKNPSCRLYKSEW
jgi:hypothetical protein